jgi:choline dehydrogenase-like flavoprotein
MTAPHDEAQQDSAGGGVLDVVVVGGSQAGLAMAWHLARHGLRFVVLEAAPELGHVWRSRWDSLKLFTPAQYDALPGMAFPAPADTYPTKDPVADYLQAYAAAVGPGCGSGRGWSTPRAVRSASPNTASWMTLGWWCGRPGTAPTTPGSTSPVWSVKATLSTGAA